MNYSRQMGETICAPKKFFDIATTTNSVTDLSTLFSLNRDFVDIVATARLQTPLKKVRRWWKWRNSKMHRIDAASEFYKYSLCEQDSYSYSTLFAAETAFSSIIRESLHCHEEDVYISVNPNPRYPVLPTLLQNMESYY